MQQSWTRVSLTMKHQPRFNSAMGMCDPTISTAYDKSHVDRRGATYIDIYLETTNNIQSTFATIFILWNFP